MGRQCWQHRWLACPDLLWGQPGLGAGSTGTQLKRIQFKFEFYVTSKDIVLSYSICKLARFLYESFQPDPDFLKKNISSDPIQSEPCCKNWGKRSLLQISQHQKPKRTSKNCKPSLHRKSLFSWSLLLQSEHWKSLLSWSLLRHFLCSDFTYGVKKDHNVEYQLPMAYYLWLPRPVGPWGVRLGSIRLG